MASTTPKTLLITGATGNQGGALLRALLSPTTTPSQPFEILALTRDPTTPSAQSLLTLPLPEHTTLTLIRGTLSDPTALFATALSASSTKSIWGVYSVQAKPPNSDISLEEVQGKALIDAALKHNVQFFVYSSVHRGGNTTAQQETSVPHWATKHRVEQHLQKVTEDGEKMRFTVLRPAAFMENLTPDFAGKALAASWSAILKDKKPLQLVAAKDIGWFGAAAFLHPDEYAGRYISLAGDELTFQQADRVFREKMGYALPATYGCVAKALLGVVKSLGAMFEWLKREENGVDVGELRRVHPGLMDLGTWLVEESRFKRVEG